jgi:hypothetical protein
MWRSLVDFAMPHAPDSALPAAAMAPLPPDEWRARARQHLERVQRWTRPWRERRSLGESHPVHDFLFEYYMYSTGRLETWHPAPHESLEDTPEARVHFGGPTYRAADGRIVRDISALAPRRREAIAEARQLLVATRERPASFGCFGMHEWAMVYRGHDVRHAGIAPLRLRQAEIDAFVERRPIVCSHFDAFRFFAPEARPLNRVPLTRASRMEREQPGCVHTNMDLYRWAYSAMPWIGSDLLWACFELAAALRTLDMQASPYDLRAFGFAPVCVETSDGRDEYQRRQRALAERARVLRDRLIDVLGDALSGARVAVTTGTSGATP